MPPPLQTSLSAEAVEEAFYDAMRRGDLAAMMALWAD
ncbi:MAG: nuclear transport factor 2 family protein, partial [Betaproteobacteria bacterium]|nr:nuclear transport factor 2 family protein [Betaproteobacteria bacterium]